ncbi:hypothetical protein [Psychrobacillus sp. MER TA 171]|uniref:hypothetical protein n=1 Tax=Psychrobacillus sp. MER TA 171 TaxID=2939577 RepID=UPI00204243CF|nr:hypothetical protein [Psychrobacillus sp. MER TA 171]
MELDIQKSAPPVTAPTGKWGKARRQFLSHRSFYPFDPEGQGGGARHQFIHRFSIL